MRLTEEKLHRAREAASNEKIISFILGIASIVFGVAALLELIPGTTAATTLMIITLTAIGRPVARGAPDYAALVRHIDATGTKPDPVIEALHRGPGR